MTTPAWRSLAAALVCLILPAATPSASAGTVVVFTVDVESNGSIKLPDQIDAVCAGGSSCGLMEIARLLEARRWSGTFFLNVFEHRQWGESAMRSIVARLQTSGQDVALHTHPQWAYDPSRWGMHQYSLDEQTAIVRDGVRLLQDWTGRSVVAHRTGAYAADERTLIALERNGLLVDSSLFWQHPNNRLDGLGLPRNLPASHGRLLQIPVTAYQREARPRMFRTLVAPVIAVRKIDADWFISEDEMRAAIDALVAARLPVIVVFLHSFSFMARSTDGARPLTNRHSVDMFRAILDHVASKNLPVVTMRDLAKAGELTLVSDRQDVVPNVSAEIGLNRYVWGRVRSTERTTFALACIGLALLTANSVRLAVRWRRTVTHAGAR